MGRGHEGRPLFATAEDLRFFVDRLRKAFARPGAELLAWAAQINHYHVVFRVGDLRPDRPFRRLNTAVAMRVRRLRGDHGAVFQGRYWSRPCEDEGAVASALTYVLGNPVHHGAVATETDLEQYEWTAYPEILGLAKPGLVDPGTTLALIHPDPAVAREQLRELVAARVARWRAQRAGIDLCEEPGCRGEADDCVLVHVRRARRLAPTGVLLPEPRSTGGISLAHDERSARRARLRAKGWRPADLVAAVCERLGADVGAVLAGSHRPAECRARAIVAFVACEGVGIAGATLAESLRVSGQAVSAARARGCRALAEQRWSVDDVLSWSERGR